MLRLAWSNVIRRPGRVLASALAVALGVGFFVGTVVVTDTMRAALRSAVGEGRAGVDAVVERHAEDRAGGATTVPLPVLERVRDIPGVAAANGEIFGPVRVTDGEGQPVSPAGRRTLLLGIAADEALRDVAFVDGRMPAGPAEIAVDHVTAREKGLAIGDRLVLPSTSAGSTREFTVSGVLEVVRERGRFGDAVLVGLPTETAAAVLNVTAFGGIDVRAEPGTTQAELIRRLDDALDGAYQVWTGAQARARETAAAAVDIDAIGTTLLVFSGLSLVAAALLVHNTFAILVSRRRRETGVVRSVGATRGQVIGGVLVESAVIGCAAALLGLGLGVLTAPVLLGVLANAESNVYTTGAALSVDATTVVAGIVVGIVVTAAAAVTPAVRAARVTPVAALRAREGGTPRRTWRGLLAAVLGGAGVALAVLGAVAGSGGVAVAATAAGGLAVVLAVLVAGPLLVPWLSAVLGRTLRPVAGHSFWLAGSNVGRDPGRSATVAAALVISLTLVTAIGTLAEATTAALEDDVARSNPFAYSLRADGGERTIPAELIDALVDDPAIGDTVAVRGGGATAEASVAGSTVRLRGVDEAAGDVGPDAVVAGSLAGFGAGTAAVDDALAKRLRIEIDDVVPVRLASDGREIRVRVVALLDSMSPFGPFTLSTSDFTALLPGERISTLLVAGADRAEVGNAVRDAVKPYPTVTAVSSAQNASQYTDAVESLRALLIALLALTVLIAFFSLANTVSLSTMDRAAELAVLRALGMTRAELARMLLAEGVLLSVVGVVLGVVLGLGVGWALSAATGAPAFVLPAGSLGVVAVLAVVAGVSAAAVPAARTARAPVAVTLGRNEL